jgi:hypothetical protein
MQSTRLGLINMLMVTSLSLNLEAKFSKREALMQAELSQKESFSVIAYYVFVLSILLSFRYL